MNLAGFRLAFKAKQLGKAIEGCKFVVKRFRNVLSSVTEGGKMTLEDTIKKQVQMHTFCRNYVKLMKREASEEHGTHFYNG